LDRVDRGVETACDKNSDPRILLEEVITMRNIPIFPILALLVLLFLGWLTTGWMSDSEDEERHQFMLQKRQEEERKRQQAERRRKAEERRAEAERVKAEKDRKREELRLQQERLKLEAQARKQRAEEEKRRLELERMRQELERKRAYEAKRQAERDAREAREEERIRNRINVYLFDLREAQKDRAELTKRLKVLEQESVDLKTQVEEAESQELDKIRTRLGEIPTEQYNISIKLKEVDRDIRNARRRLIELGWSPEPKQEPKQKPVQYRRRTPSVVLKDGTEIKYKIAMETDGVYTIHTLSGSVIRLHKSKIQEFRRP
jgi:hypothetical protein